MTVYHTYALVEPWYIGEGYDVDEEIDRKEANTPAHDLLASGEADDLLMSAAGASGQIAFELDAYEPFPDILPTSRGIKHARLWAEGYLSVWEARERRYRYPRKACWKKQRRYQAHGRV